ncbi:hypothetical protein Tsubulata_012043 [Turnera subulata]|uniref:Uncharacterized protein n=1 Tax=Turnera subulata TaxID=218843 RepID=A0A9Q0GJM2_9ROSI|nr:hypothetical protein Tsubulata_012043 [Turnera subulata]
MMGVVLLSIDGLGELLGSEQKQWKLSILVTAVNSAWPESGEVPAASGILRRTGNGLWEHRGLIGCQFSGVPVPAG